MAAPEETSKLRTLADAVSGSGPWPDGKGAWASDAGRFDVNKVSEEAEEEGRSVVVVAKRTELSVVETRMKLGPDGLGLGLAVETEKVGDSGTENGCGREEVGQGVLKGDYGVARSGEMNGSVSMVAQNGTNRMIGDLNVGNGENTMEMDGENSDGVADYAESLERHGYSVGDLVWGKIKSHPWWPGQIYDPKDASDSALKYSQTGRLLVAYFGDGSFAWCLPSQLIPFAEHFEDMSRQSSSKSFAIAVQEAVDEIGRLVEVEMTCKCVPEENRRGLNSPLAANAGIKAGVLVPEGGIGKLLSFRYDSAELLATVQNIAETVFFASVLELAILKSWLSAFYRANGGTSLPFYHQGLQIEGLEDNKNTNGVTDSSDLSVPIEVPIQGPLEEDWSLPLAGSGNGPAPSEDQIYHRRKQKSVAEIMAKGTDKKSKSRKRSITTEGTNASNSAKQRGKLVSDGAGNQNSNTQASGTVKKRGRKKINEVPHAENGHAQPEEEIHKNSLLSELNRHDTTVADDNDSQGTEGNGEISYSRERKKSKYLSPPYTSSRFRSGNRILKKKFQKESEKMSKIARIGERMTKAAGILLESPPIVKCNGQRVEEKLPEDGLLDASTSLIPPECKQKIIDTVDVNAPVEEVLAGVMSVAINPFRSWDERSPNFIRGFISAFRSSLFKESNYTVTRMRGTKRKSLRFEQADMGEGDAKPPDVKSPRTVSKKSARDKSDKPKPKKIAKGSGVKSNDKLVNRKASPASLVVTFASGFSLPSKDDIIQTFSKFGVLNEKETVVLPESSSIQIVYSSPSGAEEALKASLKQSPFGSRSVDYKLCYSSAAPMAVQSSRNTSSLYIQTSDKPVASQPAADEKPELDSIRQRLEIMTSMLEKCYGKISTKEVSKLDSEIKPLFEKVRKMAEATSY
ncbi:hypothetical protein ACH5RR_014437 [Cinchona calisaya]|uniref:PWWP domain-containing protein n=1 Tax=Cinchona calisaya TaxID=153742 RepID=A0ABD3A697_9GENT